MAQSNPIHPGKLLAQRLHAIPMSASELARHLAIPVNRVTQIINGQRSITGDSALRLGRFFGTTPEFWLQLQMIYELETAAFEKRDEINQKVAMLSDVLRGRTPPQAALFVADEAA